MTDASLSVTITGKGIQETSKNLDDLTTSGAKAEAQAASGAIPPINGIAQAAAGASGPLFGLSGIVSGVELGITGLALAVGAAAVAIAKAGDEVERSKNRLASIAGSVQAGAQSFDL